MSLRDGSSKMSKSDPSDMSQINLIDDADTILSKIKKAKTDPEPLPSEPAGLEGRPEAKNLVGIYAAFADETVEATLSRFGGQGFGAFKPALAEIVIEHLRPISEHFAVLKDDHEQIDAALAKGAAKARELGGPTLKAAYAALGLLR